MPPAHPAPSQSERDRLVYSQIWRSEGDLAPAESFTQLVELAVRASADPLIVDLGCGNGRHALYGLQHGARVVGIDHNEQAVAQASSRVAALNDPAASARAEFRQGDAFEWLAGRDADSIDGAVCYDMIHHGITGEQGMADRLRDIRRALRSGGLLLLSLLCDISYSSAERPPGRLFVSAARGSQLLNLAFALDQVVASGQQDVFIPATVSLDPSAGALVPTEYRAVRLWTLVRTG